MMYEMYVQIRDVYTANKDGVSVFISTARTGILYRGTGAKGQLRAACSWGQLWTIVRIGRGSHVFHGLGMPPGSTGMPREACGSDLM